MYDQTRDFLFIYFFLTSITSYEKYNISSALHTFREPTGLNGGNLLILLMASGFFNNWQCFKIIGTYTHKKWTFISWWETK